MEDILEHLIGYEIVDEHDKHVDMQKWAKKIKDKKMR
jgi:CBS domain containing-hemolysin-like protein